jgi:hypothetical protein
MHHHNVFRLWTVLAAETGRHSNHIGVLYVSGDVNIQSQWSQANKAGLLLLVETVYRGGRSCRFPFETLLYLVIVSFQRFFVMTGL